VWSRWLHSRKGVGYLQQLFGILRGCARRHRRPGKSDRYFLEGCEKFIARAIEQGKLSNSDNQYFDNGESVTFEPEPNTPTSKVAKLCDGVKKAGDFKA
jgi:hypothetical protein